MPFVRNTMEASIKLKPLSCTVNCMSPSTAGKLKTPFLSYFAYSPFLVLSYSLNLFNIFSMLSTLFPQELNRYLSKALWVQLSWTTTHLSLQKHTSKSSFPFEPSTPMTQVLTFCFQTFLTANLRGIFLCSIGSAVDTCALLTEEQTSPASPGHRRPLQEWHLAPVMVTQNFSPLS